MPCLLHEWGSPHEYGDDLQTVKGLQGVLQPLKLAHKSQDCRQTAAEASWPLLCVVRNASQAEMAATKEMQPS